MGWIRSADKERCEAQANRKEEYGREWERRVREGRGCGTWMERQLEECGDAGRGETGSGWER